MNPLSEPVIFYGKDLVWDYHIRTEKNYKDYYHWHQCCEILFVHEGQGNIILNQQSYDIKRGMFFFFQPFQLHHIHAAVNHACPYIRSIFYIDPLLIEKQIRTFPKRHFLFCSLWKDAAKNQVFDLSQKASEMEWIYSSYDRNNTNNSNEIEDITVLLLQILNEIEPIYSSCDNFTTNLNSSQRYCNLIMQWIEEHYKEEVNLEQIAQIVHLSPSYISKIFRKETGSNIVNYLTSRRIREACWLLTKTDLSVEQIGINIGIQNASYFNQVFKQIVGTTPLKYRKRRV